VLKIAKILQNNPDNLVLGVRTFNNGIPVRSLIGNTITKYIFALLIGLRIKDTQTGLRGIPRKSIPQLLKIYGEKYEYEMNMLIYSKDMNLGIIQEPIQTIYLNSNDSSHSIHFSTPCASIFCLSGFLFLQYYLSKLILFFYYIIYFAYKNVLLSFVCA
jgi:hypothetical protein